MENIKIISDTASSTGIEGIELVTPEIYILGILFLMSLGWIIYETFCQSDDDMVG
jgi:hypothetical protein